MTNLAAVRVRSTLFAQVTKMIMRLPTSEADKSTALTHISADADGIVDAVNTLPSVFTAPFYMGAALYSLYLVVGKVVSLAVIPCTSPSPQTARAALLWILTTSQYSSPSQAF